ncbi:hypothetical protein K2173_001527 [Erythroxylum novogranatense]|uniref:Smr domain-containing protein n=1 Tax=Erythroxylum novogranatense TaxID=1862640 RepID=A0AAV8T3S8_9ROSI|nr:hypothetical protein K2173_001527 [Erythroxylum novogranatense]
MQLYSHFLPINTSPSLLLKPFKTLKPLCSLSDTRKLALTHSLQAQTLQTLEWPSLCHRLSPFTSTSMGHSATQNANIPIGQSLEESLKLLDQTEAALNVMESGPLNLSEIEDIRAIVNSATSGTLLTVGELCVVRRTLSASSAILEKLKEEKSFPLLEILQSCNFQTELEQKIAFCIDCNLSIILDKASEDLELIRAQRKENLENLDLLLKEISTRIFQAGGVDKPLVTKRRSRFCVGVRASHKYLVPDGLVLNVSSSGATYFMEPSEAVELNNLEVMLSNSEKSEEIVILSLLTSEIAESGREIKHLLNGFQQIDLAFARAAYARLVAGVRPILTFQGHGVLSCAEAEGPLTVDIEGVRHPLLLGSSNKSLTNVLGSNSVELTEPDRVNGVMVTRHLSVNLTDFPVPINIKVGSGIRVVIISGPNAGGKTASMKTLGMASIMSKAGLFLPAKNVPRLPWFDLVLADIGDHQSLEQSLSTFSGHITRISKILEVASKESLVLIDEICSGTDPSEGVALSTSILQYLKDHINLGIVTTHYADLSLLKDQDAQFENAAMEFSLETLQPTYQILWGSTGDSNALSIAKLMGFDASILERAQNWVEKLTPEKQQERNSLIYQSLMEERNKLEAQAQEAAFLHAEIMKLYNEIKYEAEDLDQRVPALMENEEQQVKEELKAAKSQIHDVVQEFENRLKTVSRDQFSSLIRASEAEIASIVEAHRPRDNLTVRKVDTTPYTPQLGEQVQVKGLGGKLATVVDAQADDETVLIQSGKVRVRVKKHDVRAISINKRRNATDLAAGLKRQEKQPLVMKTDEEISYGPRVKTSKNTVDLRGMRVEEAAIQLNMALSASESRSVIFVIHGMGSGAVKQRALEILGKHPRVAKYEPESPLNFGCTVAYIK